jgi:hypothetical protein
VRTRALWSPLAADGRPPSTGCPWRESTILQIVLDTFPVKEKRKKIYYGHSGLCGVMPIAKAYFNIH